MDIVASSLKLGVVESGMLSSARPLMARPDQEHDEARKGSTAASRKESRRYRAACGLHPHDPATEYP